jgi:hypothetical protein
MGVDCRIQLPDDVGVRNVAKAIGLLSGLEFEKHFLGPSHEYVWSVHVPGVQVGISGMPECCQIIVRAIKNPLVDGEESHYVLYHFEPSEGGRLMLPPSTPFWCAVGDALIDFFGGKIDYNDCDDTDWDRAVPKPRGRNNPQDGEEWQRFQQELSELKPVENRHPKAVYQERGD